MQVFLLQPGVFLKCHNFLVRAPNHVFHISILIVSMRASSWRLQIFILSSSYYSLKHFFISWVKFNQIVWEIVISECQIWSSTHGLAPWYPPFPFSCFKHSWIFKSWSLASSVILFWGGVGAEGGGSPAPPEERQHLHRHGDLTGWYNIACCDISWLWNFPG
jgi:hypothetical protein